MTIHNIQEANAALQPYVPLVSQLTGKDTTLKRIKPLMKLLGNPQDKLQVIHIAGTSGKTSTAYYLAALLAASGTTVGLTVSPHVDSVLERVQINNKTLEVAAFCQELTGFLKIVEKAAEPPSYFELLYAFALWVFVRQNVAYAVVETGMGGLHDATNVVTRADKVCVITDIGFDHMHILGNTLPEIAAQKIGIVHMHNVVFTYNQSKEVMTVFKDWVTKQNAELYVTSQATEREISGLDFKSIPKFQERNWLLAYRAYVFLLKRDNIGNLTSKVLQNTLKTRIPGRMDIHKWHNKTLIMDGAHNAQKMAAFIASFQELYPGVKPAILIALKNGKDYQDVTKLLAKLASRVITTTFNSSQDLPAKSMDPAVLAKAFGKGLPVQVIPNQEKALATLSQLPEQTVVITGSFYLLSQIRSKIEIL